MTHEWWVWMTAAMALGVLEMLIPGFILLGFAIGAAIVSLLLAIGLVYGINVSGLFALFAVMSLAAWIGLRRIFKRPNDAPKTFDYDINDD